MTLDDGKIQSVTRLGALDVPRGSATKAKESVSFRTLFNQGLEGYSRDPGFDQNMVRDSGKRKIS